MSKKILELNPKFTNADRLLSLMTRYTKDHSHYNSVKDKLENMSLDDIHKSHLYFTLENILRILKIMKNHFIITPLVIK